MSGVLRWERPAPSSRARVIWREVSRALRANPGEWAVIYEGPTDGAASTLMAQVRAGQRAAMTPTQDFETERRGATVYARWIGHDREMEGPTVGEFNRQAKHSRVAELSSRGLSTAEVAALAGVSDRTVRRLRGTA